MSSDLIYTEVDTPDGALNVCEAGDDTNPMIVLVHGYPDTHRMWHPVMERLSDRFHVVAFDVRGAGQSFAPPDASQYHMRHLLSDIAAVIDTKSPDGRAHVVGHDWGSIQGWSFVADPEFAARAVSFTSMSGPHLGAARRWIRDGLATLQPPDVVSALGQLLRSSYMAVFTSDAGAAAIESAARRADNALGRRLRDAFGFPEYPQTEIERLRTVANGLELYRANLADLPPVPADPIATPVQLVVAERDPFVTADLADGAAEIASHVYRRTIGTRHWAPFDDPDTIAQWIGEFVSAIEAETVPRSIARLEQRDSRREFEDRLVLITGAGSGIGRETAFAFAELGADLVLCDVDKRGLDRTAELADLLGAGETTTHTVDVADREAMQNFADTVHAEQGTVDVLVNNAGIGLGAAFVDTSLDDWDRIVGVNLMGVVHGCHYFGREMAGGGRGGHIVNVASAAAFVPSKTLSAYTTTKSAVLGLSESLRIELGETDIGVSAICPGIINTNITRTTKLVGELDSDEMRDRFVRIYERRNYGPEKVATAVVDAVRGDRGVVPVSPEATAFYYLKRLAPGAVERFARAPWRP